MKKWLSILGIIGLTATSTTSLISCQKPNNNENEGGNKPEPTPEPQQPPENSNWELVDNISNEDATKNKDKYYFAIWKYEDEKFWRIMKLKFGTPNEFFERPEIKRIYKSFYRWDGNGEPETPTINSNTGKITDWKE